MKDLSNVSSAKKVAPDTRCSRETKRNGLERRRRISARVAMSYAAGSRQVVEWNRYLLGKIITVLFLSSVLRPFALSFSLSFVGNSDREQNSLASSHFHLASIYHR